ncbi:MAG: hypothetical protein V2A73_10075 [Pseudomonadota bacterium]
MGALVPDVELRGGERVVWVDAKYKAHLELLARRGRSGLSDEIRAEHRAGLHQALAYASLADALLSQHLFVRCPWSCAGCLWQYWTRKAGQHAATPEASPRSRF